MRMTSRVRSCHCVWRNTSLEIRFIRFLSTARLSFFLGTIRPKRAILQLLGVANSKKCSEPTFCIQLSKTRWNSTAFNKRRSGPNSRQVFNSDTKTFTTFGSTPCYNLTTIFGSHASTKAMDALTLEVAWLECTLHGNTVLTLEIKGHRLYSHVVLRSRITWIILFFLALIVLVF